MTNKTVTCKWCGWEIRESHVNRSVPYAGYLGWEAPVPQAGWQPWMCPDHAAATTGSGYRPYHEPEDPDMYGELIENLRKLGKSSEDAGTIMMGFLSVLEGEQMASVKCRYCDRLIRQELEGTWVRVNSSKSDPRRPDSRCIRNRRGTHMPPYGYKDEKKPNGDKPKMWPPEEGYKLKIKEQKPHLKLPDQKGPIVPVNHPTLEQMVLPVIFGGNCMYCGLQIFLTWGGRWSENLESGKMRMYCGGDQDSMDHEPIPSERQFCPYSGCRLPLGDCVHNSMPQPVAIRSGIWFGRWVTQACCDKCWTAEDMYEESAHCHKCPCCDCPCTRNGRGKPCGLPTRDILNYANLNQDDLIIRVDMPEPKTEYAVPEFQFGGMMGSL